MENNQPEKKIKVGAISATVWQNPGQDNQGKPTVYRTISLERSYKDKDGKWQKTSSFRVTDLPKAALILNKAYEYVLFTSTNEAEA